jgi:hypothetical protein
VLLFSSPKPKLAHRENMSHELIIPSSKEIIHLIKIIYYIDRCELWGFIREINYGIFTCVNISFFPPELLLHNYKCSGYVPCCVIVNTHAIVNWKKIREMSLTTLAHNQHDAIDVIWRLLVWNVKIIRYLASCMLQFWSNLAKISFQGILIIFVYCCKYDM